MDLLIGCTIGQACINVVLPEQTMVCTGSCLNTSQQYCIEVKIVPCYPSNKKLSKAGRKPSQSKACTVMFEVSAPVPVNRLQQSWLKMERLILSLLGLRLSVRGTFHAEWRCSKWHYEYAMQAPTQECAWVGAVTCVCSAFETVCDSFVDSCIKTKYDLHSMLDKISCEPTCKLNGKTRRYRVIWRVDKLGPQSLVGLQGAVSWWKCHDTCNQHFTCAWLYKPSL